jgi:hypothetical protein
MAREAHEARETRSSDTAESRTAEGNPTPSHPTRTDTDGQASMTPGFLFCFEPPDGDVPDAVRR